MRPQAKEINEFYEMIEELLKENKGYYNIVMGDWNSQGNKRGRGKCWELWGNMV